MELEIKQYLLPRVLFYWNLSRLVYLERQKVHDNVLGLSVGSKTSVLETCSVPIFRVNGKSCRCPFNYLFGLVK